MFTLINNSYDTQMTALQLFLYFVFTPSTVICFFLVTNALTVSCFGQKHLLIVNVNDHVKSSVMSSVMSCLSSGRRVKRGRRDLSTPSPQPERETGPTARQRKPAGSVAMLTGVQTPQHRPHPQQLHCSHRWGRSHKHR